MRLLQRNKNRRKNQNKNQNQNRRKRSVLKRTFLVLVSFSLITLVICNIWMCRSILKEKNENIFRLTLSRLQQTKDNVDSILTTLEPALSENLWQKDTLYLLLSLDLTDQERNSRIVSSLKNSVSQNSMIKDAFLYSTNMEYLFEANGKWEPLEDFAKSQVLEAYWEEVSQNHPSKEQIHTFWCGDDLFLYFEMRTPVHVGTLFYQLDTAALQSQIQIAGQRVQLLSNSGEKLMKDTLPDFRWDDPGNDYIYSTLFVDDIGYGSNTYFSAVSSVTGWIYVSPVGSASVWDTLPELLERMLPFICLYIFVCVAYSYSMSNRLYKPVYELLQITGLTEEGSAADSSWENGQDETDALSRIFQDTVEKNRQYEMAVGAVSGEMSEQIIHKLLFRGALNPPKNCHTY